MPLLLVEWIHPTLADPHLQLSVGLHRLLCLSQDVLPLIECNEAPISEVFQVVAITSPWRPSLVGLEAIAIFYRPLDQSTFFRHTGPHGDGVASLKQSGPKPWWKQNKARGQSVSCESDTTSGGF